MKTLAPFLISIILPGIGHLFLGKYVRGILIFALSFILSLFLPVLIFVFVIIALADLYYIMEKEGGRKAASRRLIFSLLIAFIILPGFFYVFGVSLMVTSDYAADHYFSEKNTKSEMNDIANALESYKQRNDYYPKEYVQFVDSKPIRKNWISDSWQNPYKYVVEDTGCFKLISAGEDQLFGTTDDLVESCKN